MGGRRRSLNDPPRLLLAAAAAVPVVAVLGLVVVPAVNLVVTAVDGAALSGVLADRRTWEVVWFTFWQASLSTLLTVLVGVWPALVVARYSFRGRSVFVGALTAVFVLPTVVLAAGVGALLPGEWGRGTSGIVVAHVVFNLAVVVRTVAAAPVPVGVEEAARTLGASRSQVALRVTLPLLAPALWAASAVVFLFSFTSFGVVRVLGDLSSSTIEVEVWRRAIRLGDLGGAAVLSVVQVVVLAVVLVWTSARQRSQRSRSAVPLVRLRRRSAVAPVVAVSVLAAAPLVALILGSFRTGDGFSLDGWRAFGSDEIRPGLRLGLDPLAALSASLMSAVVATVLAVVLGGLAVAVISVTGRSGSVLDAGVALPLGVSAVTVGLGLLITFDSGVFDWRASWWMVPLGHAVVAVPFVVRPALAAVRAVSGDLRSAAATLGASPVRAWWVTVGAALRRPLATGAGLAAAVSLGEFGATSLLSRSGSETLPVVIERMLARTGGSFRAQGHALAVVLAVVTILVVVLVDRWRDDPVRR
ncbi:MAG: ABC transporter permease [Ilumatobacteraceae bacterium]